MTKQRINLSHNMHSMMLKYLQIRWVETVCSAAWLIWRLQVHIGRAVPYNFLEVAILDFQTAG